MWGQLGAMDEDPITKDAVVRKVVAYVSEALSPTEDGGYVNTWYHVFQAADAHRVPRSGVPRAGLSGIRC